MFCREQAVQLHRERFAIHDRGAEIIMIGNGAPNFAKAFQEDFSITTPMYVDPSLESYRALGMRRGLLATLFSGKVLVHGARALRGGFRQGITRGDHWQLGGVLVVRPDGAVLYRHLSETAGDHPPLSDIIAALGTDSLNTGASGQGSRLPA